MSSIIIRAYEYTYYKLYRWSIKVNGKDYYHKYSASIMISFALMLNLFTALTMLYVFTGISVMPQSTSIYIGGLIALVIGVLNYAYFSFNNRHLDIIDRYKDESRSNAITGNRIVTSYVIGSFILLFGSWFIFI